MPDNPDELPTYERTHLAAWRKAVKAVRKKELSQAELAAAVGIHNGHLSNIEKGKRQYTQEILEKAVAYLRTWFPNLSVADLLTIDPESPETASLVDLARRVPVKQHDAAARMLWALTEQSAPAFNTKNAAKRS